MMVSFLWVVAEIPPNMALSSGPCPVPRDGDSRHGYISGKLEFGGVWGPGFFRLPS